MINNLVSKMPRILVGILLAGVMLDTTPASADPIDHGVFLWVGNEHRGGLGQTSVQHSSESSALGIHKTASGSADLTTGAMSVSATISREGGICSLDVDCDLHASGAKVIMQDRITIQSNVADDIPSLVFIGFGLQGEWSTNSLAGIIAHGRVYVGPDYPTAAVLPDFVDLDEHSFNSHETLMTSLDENGRQSITVYLYAELDIEAYVPRGFITALSGSASASYAGERDSSENLNAFNTMFRIQPAFHIELPEGFTMTSASGVFLTQANVPEPKVLGLLMTGIGTIGFARRMRRKDHC